MISNWSEKNIRPELEYILRGGKEYIDERGKINNLDWAISVIPYEEITKETKTKEMNENTKTLIKRLLRENIEEGPIGRALGTAAMAASTLMSPKVQASAPKPPTEMTSEKLGVSRNEDGSFKSTVQTYGPTKEFAKENAIVKAKNQILEKLGLPEGSIVNVKVMNIKTQRLDNGTFMCILTISAHLQ